MTTRLAQLTAAWVLVGRLEKATNRESWRDIHRAADGAVPRWIKDFVATIATVRAGIDGAALAKALKAGDVAAAVAAVPWETLERGLAQQYYTRVTELALAGAKVAAKDAALTVDWIATGSGGGAAKPPRMAPPAGGGGGGGHPRTPLPKTKKAGGTAE